MKSSVLSGSKRPVKDAVALRRRLRHALSQSRYESSAANPLLHRLEAIGKVAVFGGMIRDLVFGPPGQFGSDVDVVVDALDEAAFALALKPYPTQLNRFGGYRVVMGRWTVDAWLLRDTWAFRNGLVSTVSIESLPSTTFFNWDSAAYELRTGILYSSPRYLETVLSGVLDVNLEANHNPAGNVIRALRMAFSGRASLGPRLIEYILQFADDAVCMREARLRYPLHFGTDSFRVLIDYLATHRLKAPARPFDIAEVQLPLLALS